MTLETISLLAGIAASLLTATGVVGGFFWGISRRLSADFDRRDAETERVERAARAEIERVERKSRLAIQALEGLAKMRMDEIARDVAAHKLYAAEHFATEDGVAKALEPVLKAIDRLADRLDRILAEGVTARSAPRPPRG